MSNGINGALVAPRSQARGADAQGSVIGAIASRVKAAARFAYMLLTGPF